MELGFQNTTKGLDSIRNTFEKNEKMKLEKYGIFEFEEKYQICHSSFKLRTFSLSFNFSFALFFSFEIAVLVLKETVREFHKIERQRVRNYPGFL